MSSQLKWTILECPFNGLVGHYSCSNTRDANAYCQGIIALMESKLIVFYRF